MDEDDAFDLPSSKPAIKKAPPAKKAKALSEEDQEAADLKMAIELSKWEKGSCMEPKRKSRQSFIFDELPGSDVAEDEEEEVFNDGDKPVSDESESEDDAFEEESEEEEKKPKGKKGKAAKAPAPPKKAPAQPKAKTSVSTAKPKAKSPAAPAVPAVTQKPKPVIKAPVAPRPKTEYVMPSGGVNIPSDGPKRRVGLSRSHAPRGPLSPVKIIKSSS